MYSPHTRCRHFFAATTVALLLCGLQAIAGSAGSGRVFPTFDDGPIDVTLDILDVLKAQGIRATFFVNAIHLEGRGGENEDRAGEALRRIILEGHVLGNHSHNHMNHNRPADVYAIGAAEAYGNLETDLSYFVPASVTAANAVLGPLATQSNNRIASIARLPYSNVWMFAQLGTVCQWCGIASGPFWHPDARANSARKVSDAAGQLAVVLNQRHKIDSFGWDVHWQPRGWALPNAITTFSVHSCINLVSNGEFITALPLSIMRLCAARYALKALPVNLTAQSSRTAIVTLKNRTLGPLDQRCGRL